MRLEELFRRLSEREEVHEYRPGDVSADVDVARLEYDSRRMTGCDAAGGGVIFACVRGDNSDGHDFAKYAVEKGASALLVERRVSVAAPQIVAPNVRAVMGSACAILYGDPSRGMTMIGLTGTNGKTTTAYIIRAILRASGGKSGMLGTIVYDDGASESPAGRTTPEGPDIQLMLGRMIEGGAKYCVMETSSHGLDQGRVRGCAFDRVGFSNLTQEHLEYHNDMELYFAAKRKLFTDYVKDGWAGAANADDRYGLRLLEEFPGKIRAFSLSGDVGGEGDIYRARVISVALSGMSVEISLPGRTPFSVDSPIIGGHNASNILEGAVIADSLGVDADVVARGVAECPQVPGRLERRSLPNGVTVFVDYAHSPDGMEQALSTLSMLARGTVRVLWGAGGDRTPVKRPIVGGVMASLADHIVITTDNPRSENPADIARDVERGVKAAARNVRSDTILDRGEAIDFILKSAAPGDVVLIAGKGPERFIDYGTHRAPFVDSERVDEWARSRLAESAS